MLKKCLKSALGRQVGLLPGLLDACLAVLAGSRASELLFCITWMPFEGLDVTSRPSRAPPNVLQQCLKNALGCQVGLPPGLLDACPVVLAGLRASELFSPSPGRHLKVWMRHDVLSGLLCPGWSQGLRTSCVFSIAWTQFEGLNAVWRPSRAPPNVLKK